MKVLDATFLIDYLGGVSATKDFYEEYGGGAEAWIMPTPAYAEVLAGEGNLPDGDVAGAVEALAWGQVYGVDEQLAVTAAEIADEVGPEGPYLDGCDALIAATGRELDAPVVSADDDLTHPETGAVVDVLEYR
ncbi:PIN domain-containing protein [Halococcus agarilyticus]|uniref:PIN domain-containing protein n=1 Tax=Halococcus agarilyticus TaxID=1232219 RepID=UPI0006779980|nr:PIN domain-containing protein [Halococcus agarilyticus]